MNLPQFTFKKYLGSMMLSVDDDIELLSKLNEFIGLILSKIDKNNDVALFVITAYDELGSSFEIRIWHDLLRNKICFVSSIEDASSIENIYKITIEAFNVRRIAAELDLELHGQQGFTITKEEGSADDILKIIRNIIKIGESENLVTSLKEEKIEEKQQISYPTEEEEEIEEEEVKTQLTLCIDRVSEACMKNNIRHSRTRKDLLSFLEESGVLVLGEDAKYVCIMKENIRKCKYKIVYIEGESLISECLKKSSDVEKIIDKYLKNKYDIAVPLPPI